MDFFSTIKLISKVSSIIILHGYITLTNALSLNDRKQLKITAQEPYKTAIQKSPYKIGGQYEKISHLISKVSLVAITRASTFIIYKSYLVAV